MRVRSTHQVACPACSARANAPCTGPRGERLPGVHIQRSTAFRRASLEAIHALYAPLRSVSGAQSC